MGRRLLGLIAVVGVGVAATCALHVWRKNQSLGDPDRYFHFAVSRMAVEGGLVRTLPQAEDVGWGWHYPDKEFLFHVVTAAAHRLGGERGVEAVVPIVASLAIVGVVALVHGVAGLPWAAVPALAPLFLSPDYLFRMNLLRPHLLAVLFFVLLLIGLLRRSPVVTAAACAGYALSYHAVYVPGVVLALHAISELGRARGWRPAAAGLIGLAVGTFANPYFPENVVMGWKHFWIALSQGSADIPFGAELVPMRTDVFLFRRGFFLLILVFALVKLVDDSHRLVEAQGKAALLRDDGLRRLAFALAAAAVFFGLMGISPRAIEYLAPLTALVVGQTIAVSRRKVLVALCLGGMAVLLQGPFAWPELRAPVERPSWPDEAIESVRSLPPEASGSKVYHCEWDVGSYILYARPDLRFVDLLDPTFLRDAAPALYSLRSSVNEGYGGDLYGVFKYAFKADYVLCRHRGVIAQLEGDPNFELVHPAKPDYRDFSGTRPFLYRLRPERVSNQVTELEVSRLPLVEAGRYLETRPEQAGKWERVVQEDKRASLAASAYLNLFRWLDEAGARPAPEGGQAQCVVVRPTAETLAAHEGATFLGLGGGRNLRAWHNREPLFSSIVAISEPRALAVLVPLRKPLRRGDRVEVVVCSGISSSYMGTALSFWNGAEIQRICSTRRSRLVSEQFRGSWAYRGTPEWTCLGPLAVPQSGRIPSGG